MLTWHRLITPFSGKTAGMQIPRTGKTPLPPSVWEEQIDKIITSSVQGSNRPHSPGRAHVDGHLRAPLRVHKREEIHACGSSVLREWVDDLHGSAQDYQPRGDAQR